MARVKHCRNIVNKNIEISQKALDFDRAVVYYNFRQNLKNNDTSHSHILF